MEFVPEFAAEARSLNPDADIVCMDATQFQTPSGPCVLYFFNPFQGYVMKTVVENIEESLRVEPRDAIVIYYRPQWHRIWDESTVFRRVYKEIWTKDWFMVYRSC